MGSLETPPDKQSDQPPIERLVHWLGERIRQRPEPKVLWRRFLRACTYLNWLLAGSYTLSLLTYCILLRQVGERWWPLWFCIFAPQQLLLLPIVFIAPLCLLFCPRALYLLLGATVLCLVLHMNLQLWPGNVTVGERPTLSLITCNTGQRNQARLTPFIEARGADVLALQDARGRGARYARHYEDWQVAEEGEFVVVSRLPILDSAMVEHITWHKMPVAAWFDLDWNGERLRLYNVHMPSPRRELGRLRGVGMLKEWVRWRGWFGHRPEEGVAAQLEGRFSLYQDLVREISGWNMPVLVAGDLNVPDWGCIYKMTSGGELRDAFRESGRGYGFTFPGYSRNPLTGFGPWLRLDYVFVNRYLETVAATVEQRSRAQHRALGVRVVRQQKR